MKRISRIFIVDCILALTFLAAGSTFGAEEGAKATGENATEIFKWINFAIVVVILLWVFGKKLPPVFQKKSEMIGSAIAKATAAKAAADGRLREAESKLANLQTEVAELRAQAARESAAEVERIHAATQSDTQKIGLAAKAEIEATERAARLELKALAAKLAVEGAESLLVKQLTPTAQESLINNFVKSLDGRPN
jgi:F-type H+-transporting ATPase subunit b